MKNKWLCLYNRARIRSTEWDVDRNLRNPRSEKPQTIHVVYLPA